MKKIRMFLAALLLMTCLPLAAFAADTVILEPTGSITVKVVYKETPLKGMRLTAYRVGDLVETENGSLEFQRVFVRKTLNAQLEADPKALADELLEFVENNPHMVFAKQTEPADLKGNILFKDCQPGVYLIVQEEEYSLDGKKYEKLNHFLVTVPYNEKYQVDVTGKASLDVYQETEPTTPTTEPDDEPGNKLPQTGQTNWPVPMLACGGMLLFGLGWYLFRNEEKNGYEA